MTIPDYQTLMLPVLRRAAVKEVRVPEISDRIADEFGLSQAERDQLLPSGRHRLLHNRLHWAKFYLNKAGLVASAPRNRFTATDAGKNLLARNPSRITNDMLLEYPSFKDFYESSSKDEAK
jgi:restriction system protein